MITVLYDCPQGMCSDWFELWDDAVSFSTLETRTWAICIDNSTHTFTNFGEVPKERQLKPRGEAIKVSKRERAVIMTLSKAMARRLACYQEPDSPTTVPYMLAQARIEAMFELMVDVFGKHRAEDLVMATAPDGSGIEITGWNPRGE